VERNFFWVHLYCILRVAYPKDLGQKERAELIFWRLYRFCILGGDLDLSRGGGVIYGYIGW